MRGALGVPDESSLLLTVSRLSFWKRVDRSIRLVAALQAKGRDVHLAVVGSGHEEGRLRDLAAELGVSSRIHFVGGVARADLPSYYASADMLLSLYDFSNLANPVLEAMLLGCPVIAYDVGGTSDLVVDRINGLLIRTPDDIEALTRTVSDLLDDDVRRGELSGSAQTWAAEHLRSWAERMQLEIAELDALIEAHSPGGASADGFAQT